MAHRPGAAFPGGEDDAGPGWGGQGTTKAKSPVPWKFPHRVRGRRAPTVTNRMTTLTRVRALLACEEADAAEVEEEEPRRAI